MIWPGVELPAILRLQVHGLVKPFDGETIPLDRCVLLYLLFSNSDNASTYILGNDQYLLQSIAKSYKQHR